MIQIRENACDFSDKKMLQELATDVEDIEFLKIASVSFDDLSEFSSKYIELRKKLTGSYCTVEELKSIEENVKPPRGAVIRGV